jgi:CheY-like chemotaxis protein
MKIRRKSPCGTAKIDKNPVPEANYFIAGSSCYIGRVVMYIGKENYDPRRNDSRAWIARVEDLSMTANLEQSRLCRPRLVLAHPDAAQARTMSRYFHRLGWETHLATSAAQVRLLVRQLDPGAVILSTELHDESGWLTCDKLLLENPQQRVILIAGQSDSTNRHFASFVGAAAIVHEDAGLQALAEELASASVLAPMT